MSEPRPKDPVAVQRATLQWALKHKDRKTAVAAVHGLLDAVEAADAERLRKIQESQ